MLIETERLEIEPFTLETIDAVYNKDLEKMENLGFIVNEEWPDQELFEILPIFREMIIANGVNGFNAWIVSEKATKQIVGSIGFIGNPDKNGNVEIGFGITPNKRRKGYGNESAKAIIEWALSKNEVNNIEAKCEIGNIASKSILGNIGLHECSRRDGLIIWEKENRKNHPTIAST